MTMQDPGTPAPITPAAAPASPAAAPAAAPAAVQAPPAPLPVQQAPAATVVAADPVWLKSRLDREHEKASRDILAKIGVGTVEEAAAATKLAKAQAEAGKTAEQKAVEAERALATEKSRSEQALSFATEYSARLMVGLTPAQAEAVKAIAGEDPVKQGQTIMRLAPTWAKAEQVATAQVQVAAPAAVVASPSTAAVNSAPNGIVAPPADARAKYQELRKSNPFAAALYGEEHPEIFVPQS